MKKLDKDLVKMVSVVALVVAALTFLVGCDTFSPEPGFRETWENDQIGVTIHSNGVVIGSTVVAHPIIGVRGTVQRTSDDAWAFTWNPACAMTLSEGVLDRSRCSDFPDTGTLSRK